MIAVAAALYLADCAVLLQRGQGVLLAGWPGARLLFGSTHYQIAGRAVALLNPFTPFVPALRTQPLFSAAAAPKAATAAHALSPIALPVLVQFILVFAVLPACLYRAPGWPFAVALLAAYANAIAMLVLLFFRFRQASLSVRPLVALGFGWLVCLPLSANCLRAAGLSFRIAVDARRAMRFLSEAEGKRAREDLAAHLGEALQEIDEGDAAYGRLADLRRQLAAESGHERA